LKSEREEKKRKLREILLRGPAKQKGGETKGLST